MGMIERFVKFMCPDPWEHCHAPTEAERLAAWERRLGEHRAEQRLKAALEDQIMDMEHAAQFRVVVILKKRQRAYLHATWKKPLKRAARFRMRLSGCIKYRRRA